MSSHKLTQQVVHSLKWTVLGKVFTQAIRWVVTFWVIRLLSPDDYGLVAMADVFYSFILLFMGGLFTPYLIQSKEVSTELLKKTFGMIIIVHTLAFILQYSLADTVADYYNSEKVAEILKINAWCFLIIALEVIPAALLSREMKFKQVSIIAAISNIIAALSTLSLAFLGYGFWALVIGELIAVSIRTLLVLFIQPIKFLPSFGIKELAPFIKFGSLVTAHSILFYIFLHLDVAIAGRILSAEEIGLFAVAIQFALMPQKKILPLLKQVAFPAFAKIQDNQALINSYILKAQRLSLVVAIPIFWGLAAMIDTIIPVLLGEKWLGAVLPTMIVLFVMPLRFSEELYNPAFKSQKKIKHLIGNVLILTFSLSVTLLFTISYGAIGIAAAWAIAFPIGFGFVIYRNAKQMNIEVRSLLSVFVKPVTAGILMLVAVFGAKQLLNNTSSLLELIVPITTGIITYAVAILSVDKSIINDIRKLIKKD